VDEPAEPKRRKGWDISALVLLLIGGFVFVIGWIVGVILLWTSPRWLWGEKLLGTFVLPGGLLLPAFVGFWYVPGWGACDSEYQRLPNGDVKKISCAPTTASLGLWVRSC
jgi:hypothetical protein